MSKMGISTIQSYRGAPDLRGDRPERRVRQALLRQDGDSRVGGIGLDEIAAGDALSPPPRLRQPRRRAAGCSWRAGQYQWRRDGETHLFNPETVFRLQHATPGGPLRHLQEIHPDGRRAERAALHAARAVRVPVRQGEFRCRSRRSSRSSRSSSGSPPAR